MVGVIPPPVTGMTSLTRRVVDEFSKAGNITFCNWSAGTSRHGLLPWARRTALMLTAVARLIRRGRRPGSRLYITANSKGAMILTALLVYTGCSLGYRVYLHHHTYVYVERFNRWMSLMDRWMSKRGVHIVHCDTMAGDFRRMYNSQCEFRTVHPSIVSLELAQARTAAQQPFRLGHLSNLSVAKGLDLAIRTFTLLRDERVAVELRLAGPCLTRQARELVDNVVANYPGAVQYVGPVYGDDKRKFFADIDAFLFPTQNESWGIVINEALASGAPVITIDRGCTRTVVGKQAGLAMERGLDYATVAAQQVRHWIDNPAEYRAMSEAAIEQACSLHREAQAQLDQLIGDVFSAKSAPTEAQAVSQV